MGLEGRQQGRQGAHQGSVQPADLAVGFDPLPGFALAHGVAQKHAPQAEPPGVLLQPPGRSKPLRWSGLRPQRMPAASIQAAIWARSVSPRPKRWRKAGTSSRSSTSPTVRRASGRYSKVSRAFKIGRLSRPGRSAMVKGMNRGSLAGRLPNTASMWGV